MASQQYCLKWNNHQLNLLKSFDRLLQSESFTDVTLACEGRSLRAHKVVLSACSNYFETLFEEHPDKSPIIILKDMKFDHISQLVNFMYRGEINITQDMLSGLLRTAETLKVKGLAEVSGDQAAPAAAAASAAAALAAAHQFSNIPQTFRIRPPVSHLVPSAGAALTAALSIPSSTPNLPSPLTAFLNPGLGFAEQRVNLLKRMREEEHSMPEPTPPPAPKYIKKEVKTEFLAAAAAAAENHMIPIAPRLETSLQSATKSTVAKQNGDKQLTPKTPKRSDGPVSPISQQDLNPIPPEIMNPQCDLPEFLQGFQVFRLNDYLGYRTRQQFWEEPAVRRIMEGIKNKEIDMKSAAELLGVSYGTLYGRYREVFGYLKHAWVNKPNRTSNNGSKEKTIWSEARSQEVIKQVLSKELSLTAAAVRLGVDYNTFFAHLTDNGANQDRVNLLSASTDKVADDVKCGGEIFFGDEENSLEDEEDKGAIDTEDDEAMEHSLDNEIAMNGDHVTTEDMSEEETEDVASPQDQSTNSKLDGTSSNLDEPVTELVEYNVGIPNEYNVEIPNEYNVETPN